MVGKLSSMQTEADSMSKIETIRIRSENAGSVRHTLTWFAPELDYIPIKIEQHKRGDLVARLTLVKLRSEKGDFNSVKKLID